MKNYIGLLLMIFVIVQSPNLPEKIGFDTLNIGSQVQVYNNTIKIVENSYLQSNELLSVASTYKNNIEYVYSMYYKLLTGKINEDTFINDMNIMGFNVTSYYSLSQSGVVKVYVVKKDKFSVLLAPKQTFGLSSNYTKLQNFGSEINWEFNDVTTKINATIIRTPDVTYIDMIKYGEGNVIVTIETSSKVITRVFSTNEDVVTIDKNDNVIRIVVWKPYGGFKEISFDAKRTIYSLKSMIQGDTELGINDELNIIAPKGVPIKITYYDNDIEKQLQLKYYLDDQNKLRVIYVITNDVTIFHNIIRPKILRVYYYDQVIGFIKLDRLINVDVVDGMITFSTQVGDITNIFDLYVNGNSISVNKLQLTSGTYKLVMKSDNTIYDTFYVHVPNEIRVNVVYDDKNKKYIIQTFNDPVKVYLLEPSKMIVKKVETIQPYSEKSISAKYAIIVGGKYYYHPISSLWGNIWILKLIIIIVIFIAGVKFGLEKLYKKGKIPTTNIVELISYIRNKESEETEESIYEDPLIQSHFLALTNILNNKEKISEELSPEDFELELLVINRKKDESYSVWIDKYNEYGIVIKYRRGKNEVIKINGKELVPAYIAHKVAILLRSVPNADTITKYLNVSSKNELSKSVNKIGNKENEQKNKIKEVMRNIDLDSGIKI